MNFLSGKLTYIVAGITIIWAIAGFFLGHLDSMQAGVLILGGLGTFGIRRSIREVEKKV